MSDEIRRDVDDILPGQPETLRTALVLETGIAQQRPVSETNCGTIPAAVEASGIPLDPDKRRTINLAIASLALAGLGLLGQGASLFLNERQIRQADEEIDLAKEQIRQTIKAEETNDWQITSDFAAHIATVNYAADPLAGFTGTVNEGARSILASMQALRERELLILPDVHKKIERAIAASTSEQGKCIALSRLAIDNSFMGDGDAALNALTRINLQTIDDDKTILRLLDFGTSVALNAIDPLDFAEIKSSSLASLEKGWTRIGIDETRPDKIAQLASEYGVGVFSIAQHAAIADLSTSAFTKHAVHNAREAWFKLLQDVVHSLDVGSEMAFYAEDFLYSLHRPAFHAAAWHDHDTARRILDYYFGRTTFSTRNEGAVSLARERFRKDLPGSSPWVFLLDAAYERRPEHARSMVLSLSKKSYKQTPQFKKALVHLGMQLHIPHQELLLNLRTTSAKLEAFSTTIHRVYMAEASKRVEL